MVRKINGKKALFIQRFIAFIIDILIVTTVASIISMPFIDTSKNNKYSQEAIELQEKVMNDKIKLSEYIVEYNDISYKIARDTGFVALITIFLNICYFIIFQLKMNGQTIGKKIMKIQIVSNEGNLFMNQMILRSMLSNFILMDIISFVFMLFLPKSIFLYGLLGIEIIQYVLVIVSALLIMFRKDGRSIHDILLHTKVVRV